MTFVAGVAPQRKKIKVNWAHECVLGAMISAAFTVFASNAGTEGVLKSSISDRLHDFIIIGGITMGTICGLAAVFLIFVQTVEMVVRKLHAATRDGWMPFGNLRFAKFVKIFLP